MILFTIFFSFLSFRRKEGERKEKYKKQRPDKVSPTYVIVMFDPLFGKSQIQRTTFNSTQFWCHDWTSAWRTNFGIHWLLTKATEKERERAVTLRMILECLAAEHASSSSCTQEWPCKAFVSKRLNVSWICTLKSSWSNGHWQGYLTIFGCRSLSRHEEGINAGPVV